MDGPRYDGAQRKRISEGKAQRDDSPAGTSGAGCPVGGSSFLFGRLLQLSLSLYLQLLSLLGVEVPRLPPRGRSECLRMVVSPRDLSQPSCRFLASPSRTGKQSAQRGLASRQREKEAARTTAGRFLLDSRLLARQGRDRGDGVGGCFLARLLLLHPRLRAVRGI